MSLTISSGGEAKGEWAWHCIIGRCYQYESSLSRRSLVWFVCMVLDEDLLLHVFG